MIRLVSRALTVAISRASRLIEMPSEASSFEQAVLYSILKPSTPTSCAKKSAGSWCSLCTSPNLYKLLHAQRSRFGSPLTSWPGFGARGQCRGTLIILHGHVCCKMPSVILCELCSACDNAYVILAGANFRVQNSRSAVGQLAE